MNIWLEFLIALTIVAIPLYLLPVSVFYFLFDTSKTSITPIQVKKPTSKDIKREIILSLQSILLFAILSTALLQLVKADYTQMYFEWSAFPVYYHALSFFLCLILHDTYFYWSHRFMHLPGVFKYFHKGHHLSFTPTPWASFAFQPMEVVIQFLTFAIIVFVIPIHPIVFFLYLFYDTLVNTAGHTGVELVPKVISSNRWLKYGNTVTHHDLHHIYFNKNFGAFFNIWDRIMGTFLEEDPKKSS